MKKYFITGVSGTGKSTVAEILKTKGINTIDLDHIKNLCKWINVDTHKQSYWHPGIGKDFFEKHEYLCDRNMLLDLIDKYNNIVVVVGLADKQSNLFDIFDKVFLFQCKEDIFMNRITNRTNHVFGNDISEREMIKGWYKDFEKEMLEKGAIPIETSKPINEVVDEIIRNINTN